MAHLKRYLGLQGNALVISITELVHDSGSHLIWSFWPLYVLALGGDVVIIGFFSILAGILNLIFHPFLGYLVDRVGRKKPVVYGGFIVATSPFLLALANDWVFLIPGFIIHVLDGSLWTSRQTLFSDNIDEKHRARSFAVFYTVFGLTASFLPIFGGVLLDKSGTILGFKIGLIINGATLFIQSIANAKYLKDDSKIYKDKRNNERSQFQIGNIKEGLKPLFKREIRAILIGQSIASFGMGLSNSFTVVYANQLLLLTKTEWGIITSFSNITNTIIRIPIGASVDIIGRRKGLLLGYLIQASYPILFVSFQGFLAVLAIQVFNTIGGTLTVTSREALMVDLTDQYDRGRVLGVFAAIAGNGGLFGSISPNLGAYLWDNLSPAHPFVFNTFFKTIALTYLFIKFKKMKS